MTCDRRHRHMFARRTITDTPTLWGRRRHACGGGSSDERASAHAQDQCVDRASGAHRSRWPSPAAADRATTTARARPPAPPPHRPAPVPRPAVRSTARAPRSASSCRTPRPRRGGSPPTPTALKADCQKFNLDCNIQNAGGSAAKMQTIARQMTSDRDQGPDDRRPRPGLRREDRAGGRQERRHPRRLRPAHPGWRRGALRLLRQRQGRRGAGQDPDPVPAGRERQEREVRRDRRRAHRQQRHAVQAGLRQRAVQDGRLDQGRASRPATGTPRPRAACSARCSARTRTSRPSWSPTTRWPAR